MIGFFGYVMSGLRTRPLNGRTITMEHVQALHLVSSILSGYLFVIFAWWWMIKGNPTTIYKLTCFIMLGICLSSIAAFVVMWRVSHGETIDAVYDCDEAIEWFICLRQYLIILPLIGYAVHVTRRFLYGKPTEYDGPERRGA